MKQLYLKYLKILFPVLFIAYLGGIISFTHVHVVNGITIVHSHPFSTNGDVPVDHQHTGTELQLLHQISTILQADNAVSFTNITTFLPAVRVLLSKPIKQYHLLPQKDSNQLRAPPLA